MNSSLRKAVTLLGLGCIRMLLWTCRLQVEGLDHFLTTAKKKSCILMLWHDRLALTAPILWKYCSNHSYAAMVSKSRDGKFVQDICESYPGCRIISVAHDGRHHALREMIQQLKKGQEVILITPDGPRGPRHKVKRGLGMAARIAETPVVPFTWSASRFWQWKSWDKFLIPKPFSKIVVKFGPAICLNTDQGETELEQALVRLTESACEQVTYDRAKWPE